RRKFSQLHLTGGAAHRVKAGAGPRVQPRLGIGLEDQGRAAAVPPGLLGRPGKVVVHLVEEEAVVHEAVNAYERVEAVEAYLPEGLAIHVERHDSVQRLYGGVPAELPYELELVAPAPQRLSQLRDEDGV